MNSKKPLIKPKHCLRTVLAWFLLALASFALAYGAFVYGPDLYRYFSYRPDAEIKTLTKRLELSSYANFLLRAAQPVVQDATSFNRSCPSVTNDTSTLGCYYRNHIYVYNVQNSELDGIKESVLAHELMHSAWAHLTNRERSRLAPLLRRTYEAHRGELEEHMASYEASDFVDELHSVMITQLNFDQLDGLLQRHYAEYFQNPPRLAKYYLAYSEKFNQARRQVQTLYQQIQSQKQEIERRSSQYRLDFAQLSSDIDTYNQRASAGYSSDFERRQLQTERSNLLKRQSMLDAEHQAIADLVASSNQLVNDYNNLIDRLSLLTRSIDSTANNLPTVQLDN